MHAYTITVRITSDHPHIRETETELENAMLSARGVTDVEVVSLDPEGA